MHLLPTDYDLWKDWRLWAVAIPLGAALVFVLPMLFGWSL